MDSKEEVVLVTGGTGLVGTAVQSIVNSDKNQFKGLKFVFVNSKDADLSDLTQTRSLFERTKPDYVIHLAALVAGFYKNLRNHLKFLRTNLFINDNVLRMSHEFKVKKCISCLSTCTFPEKTKYPMDETMVHLGPPHQSIYGYSYAKRMVDILNKAYENFYKYNTSGDESHTLFTSVIPTNIYGPNDNFNFEDSHVIPGLIHKAYNAMKDAKDRGLKQNAFSLIKYCFYKQKSNLNYI